MEDNWKHKSEGMLCKTCMYHVSGRCRRHAPTMQGYPAVFPTDWCGDHKLDKDFMQTEKPSSIKCGECNGIAVVSDIKANSVAYKCKDCGETTSVVGGWVCPQ